MPKWSFTSSTGLLSTGMLWLWMSCQSLKSDGIAALTEELPELVDYNFHVKPILSDRCFKCHGPDANQRKGDLRLDVPEDALKPATGPSSVASRVISPFNLRKSELVHRFLSNDPEYMMPPPESNLQLDDYEKAILFRWIEQGAQYKKHWAFVVPEKKPLPLTKDEESARTPIDHYIGQKLRSARLQPSAEAEPATLLRRIALDLTGLPPTPEEQLRFLDGDTLDVPDVIDYYLALPQYGERMAMEWLDLARYADSHGYQDDGMRNTWPWRDWVIRQFNQNMPYDTFLLWQLAGDLLSRPTPEQLLATCFNRNHPQTQEGGVVDEEYRVEYVADRTNTLGKGILGLTMECARCHDHKYDPITQKDYYALYAFFNNNNDAGIVPYDGEASPTLLIPGEDASVRLDSLQKQIDYLEKLSSQIDTFQPEFEQWWTKNQANPEALLLDRTGLMAEFLFEKEISLDKYAIHLDKGPAPRRQPGEKPTNTYTFFNKQKQKPDAALWGHPDDRPQIVEDGHTGRGVSFTGDAGIRLNRDLDFDRDQPFAVSIWVKFLRQGEEGPIFGKTNGDFEGYRGYLCKLNSDGTLSFQLNHVWPDNCIDFQTVDPVPVNTWTHIVMSYDGSSRAEGVKFYINGQQPDYRLHADHLRKSILHGVKGSNWSNQPFLIGMELRKSIQHMVADDLLIFNRRLSAVEVSFLFDQRVSNDREAWFDFYLASGKNKRYNEVLRQLQLVRWEQNKLVTDQPEVMIMHEKKYPRPTYVLDRGAYDAPSEPVEPAIPEIFREGQTIEGRDRLSLAKWVIDPENPLTARVQVNRLWKICFGKGLVSTQEDFGSQGSLPTHPELLDYLALRFVELDWDIKAMLREIMLSATYRQSSKPSAEAREADPDNHFYSHYPAHRLSAEIIRDQALAACGLLVKQIGGPSVYPYQPDGIWEALATRNATKYRQQSGDSLYRRSLYTIWKRSSPPPAMLSFDAPDRYYCVVNRQKTATPLQSLVLMNDPQFVEAARVLGEKMMKMPELDDAIDLAFRTLLGRKSRPDELQETKELWDTLYSDFSSRRSDASALLSVGESLTDPELDKDRLAAHAMVASALMNYDDFVVKR